jgi:hypothetical protein
MPTAATIAAGRGRRGSMTGARRRGRPVDRRDSIGRPASQMAVLRGCGSNSRPAAPCLLCPPHVNARRVFAGVGRAMGSRPAYRRKTRDRGRPLSPCGRVVLGHFFGLDSGSNVIPASGETVAGIANRVDYVERDGRTCTWPTRRGVLCAPSEVMDSGGGRRLIAGPGPPPCSDAMRGATLRRVANPHSRGP